MKNETKMLLKATGCVCSVISFVGITAYSIATTRKLNRLANRFGIAVDQIAKDTNIDIPQEIIDEAMNQAVQKAAEKQVRVAATAITTSVSADMRKEIKTLVDEASTDLKSDVEKEMKRQIKNVDISEIKKNAIKELKESAAKRMDEELDDIIEKCSDQLDSVNRIYKSIADKMED